MERVNGGQDGSIGYGEVTLYMDDLGPPAHPNGPLLVDAVDEGDVRRAVIRHRDEAIPMSSTTGGRPRNLETDNTGNPRPTHGPEIDDLVTDDDEGEEGEDNGAENGRNGGYRHNGHYPGIDDGLLPDNRDEDKVIQPIGGSRAPSPHPGFAGDSWGVGFSEVGMPSAPGMPRVPPDLNLYQQKKIVAQGMMDLALFSANANQLRYVLQASSGHPYYYPALVMICSSLVLQSVVGMFLIWNSRYNVKDDEQLYKANRSNNWLVIAVFVVTILNVFISSFGVVDIPRFNGNSALHQLP